ncbi:hypothetical protein CLTEP_15200 [Clostridium tepidiprofundi DSM 19306]|uniref:Uncharacterized protein n=1 Tax=Clostridium tepidiprofundi DSM 19306 TaxID=1121338 RepID=A0A151B3Z0_9CLOT|nr:hypothetical protein [Clostridium tepidiprofundi]KYH34472.1 hypothetical protein CLTEP_15200 [Clostridium tepidiprofundi DSM 19306]
MDKEIGKYETIEMDNEEYEMVPMEPMMNLNEYAPVQQTMSMNEYGYEDNDDMVPLEGGFFPTSNMMYLDYMIPTENEEYYTDIEERYDQECDCYRKKKKNKHHDHDYHNYNDVVRIVRKIERYNPGIYRMMRFYGVPYPVANRLLRRIVRLTLMYYDD